MTDLARDPRITVEIRKCELEERQQWGVFLDRNFGYAEGQSYATDFAPLFESEALDRSRIAIVEGRIAASASGYPVTLLTPRARMPVTIVGAVATDERHRGLGYSKAVLAEIERDAVRGGSAGLVLWSDKIEFYQKLGFFEVGRQELFSLARFGGGALVDGDAEYRWDWPQVRDLYERHSHRIARTEKHWSALAGITSCTRAQWRDRHGLVSAYLAFDRGRDLKGIVHEWGGERNALMSLVRAVLKKRPELLWLSSPVLADAISPMLGAPIHEGALARFKPLIQSVRADDLSDAWFWGLDSL